MSLVTEHRLATPLHHPELVELAQLEARITEGAGHLAAATGAWLSLIEEFDRREGWAVHGLKSCAHWLSWKCGLSLVTGREHVRVARALAELPATRAALAAGRLSYSKVRALTRVATPENEANLVQTALHCTGAQLDQLTAGIRKAGSLGKVNARHEARSLTWRWAEDGSLVLQARLPPEEGALVLAALDAARDSLPTEKDASAEASGDTGGTYPTRVTAQAHADAMVVLAETMLASDPAPAPEDGPELHPETLRRLCCDSGAVIVAHHEKYKRDGRRRGTWMDVGRRTRVVPAALRRALMLRDGGCRFPGCTETRFVDAHHVIYWSRGGPTVLRNLIMLCRRHHRYVHEGGYTVVADGLGGFAFHRPDGLLIPDVPTTPGGNAEALQDLHGAVITPTTTIPNWNGDRLDLHHAVWVYTQQPRVRTFAGEWVPTPPTEPTRN